MTESLPAVPVARHLNTNIIELNMKDYILVRNLTIVNGVGKDLPILAPSVSIETKHGVKMLKVEIETRKRAEVKVWKQKRKSRMLKVHLS